MAKQMNTEVKIKMICLKSYDRTSANIMLKKQQEEFNTCSKKYSFYFHSSTKVRQKKRINFFSSGKPHYTKGEQCDVKIRSA